MPTFHKLQLAKVLPFIDVDVDGPTLVRVNRLFTSAGVTIFAPTTGGAIWLSAWPYSEQPPGTSTEERMSHAWRGTGPLIFLPFKGRWMLNLNVTVFGGALLPAIGLAELSLIQMPPEVAAVYLQQPPASFHVSGNFALAAGAGTNLFSATGVDLSTQVMPAFWHSLVELRVTNNTTPALTVMFAVGRTAAAGVGRVIPALNAAVYTWQDIAGQSAWIFNAGAGAIDVNVEAHFL